MRAGRMTRPPILRARPGHRRVARGHRRAPVTRRRHGAAAIALMTLGSLWPSQPAQGASAARSAPSAPTATVSDGQRVLQASRTADLDPAGERIVVSGHGFDVHKGIYVAFCAVPPPGTAPGPCGGGEDRAGATGASAWISSNPPPYGVGVATPYGPGGTFTVELSIQPVINATTDCRRIRCAIATRNDHTRSSDRSQDLLLPVAFRDDPATPTPPGLPTDPPPSGSPPSGDLPAPNPAAHTTSTTPTSTATTVPAPPAVLGADGLTATAGSLQLRLSHNVLDPEGDRVRVHGSGLDPATAVQVALCSTPTVGDAPDACAPGADAPVAGDGSFDLHLAVDGPMVDDRDCRQTACAVLTRNAVDPSDRSFELAVPVRFATRSSADPDPPTSEQHPEGSSPSTSTGRAGRTPLVVASAALVAGGGGLAATLTWIRRRRRGVDR